MGLFDMFSRAQAQTAADEISHDALEAALRDGKCALIDVREPHEYASGKVPGSVNIPMSRLDPANLPQSVDVVLICRSGMRSANAMNRAHAAGRKDVRHYRGGVMGWHSRGGKIV